MKVFKIKKALAFPLLLDTLLIAVLLAVTIMRNGTALEIIVLLVGFVPLLLISLEISIREVITSDSGIQIRKILRKKILEWGDITHVGVVVLYKKVYLVMTTTKGFHIVSNAYGDFTGFVREIMSRVEKDRIEEQVAGLIEKPVRRVSDILLSWLAAIVITGIIVVKLIS